MVCLSEPILEFGVSELVNRADCPQKMFFSGVFKERDQPPWGLVLDEGSKACSGGFETDLQEADFHAGLAERFLAASK